MTDTIFINDYGPNHHQHRCRKSVATEVTVPGTNFVFCLDGVSCCYNEDEKRWELKVETSIETRKRSSGPRASFQEKIILRDCYTLDVSRFVEEQETVVPIDVHSHP